MDQVDSGITIYDASTPAGACWRPKYLHVVGICLAASVIITNVFSAHRVFEWVEIKELELREHTRKDFKSEIFLVS